MMLMILWRTFIGWYILLLCHGKEDRLHNAVMDRITAQFGAGLRFSRFSHLVGLHIVIFRCWNATRR